MSELELTSLLREHASAHAVPGAALGLLREGAVSTAYSGIADTRTGEPVTSGTRFAVGSLAKSMVATVVARLAETDRLSLDDPVAIPARALRTGPSAVTSCPEERGSAIGPVVNRVGESAPPCVTFSPIALGFHDCAATLGHDPQDGTLPADDAVPSPHRAAAPIELRPPEAPSIEPRVDPSARVGSTQHRERRILEPGLHEFAEQRPVQSAATAAIGEQDAGSCLREQGLVASRARSDETSRNATCRSPSIAVTAADAGLRMEGDGRTVEALPIDDCTFVVDADDPDTPTVTFGAVEDRGRPRVLYQALWGLPRVDESVRS
jgi:Beta-lactamase